MGTIKNRGYNFQKWITKIDHQSNKIFVSVSTKKLILRHVVITSVDRDDLKNDYGAIIWKNTIKEIRKLWKKSIKYEITKRIGNTTFIHNL